MTEVVSNLQFKVCNNFIPSIKECIQYKCLHKKLVFAFESLVKERMSAAA